MSGRRSVGGGGASNHRGSGGGGDDVYRQLIDSNDLVRELDDIEAISQQISQHAEVLYQSWKNNASSPNSASPSRQQQQQLQQQQQPRRIPIQRQNSAPPSHASPPGPSSSSFSSPYSSPANGGVRPRENGVGGHGHGHVQSATLHRIPMSSTNHRSPPPLDDDRGGGMMNGPTTSTAPTRLHEQIARAQSAYEPVRSATLPSAARVRSASNGSPAPAAASSSPSSPSEGGAGGGAGGSGGGGFDRLLSSPEMNGNLKDLVNSFVSTDRAKQAARHTISTTINNMKSRNGGGGVRSPSPSTASR